MNKTVYIFENANGGYIGQLWARSAPEALHALNEDRNLPVRDCRHQEGGHRWPVRIDCTAIRMKVAADGLHCSRSTEQF